MVLQNYLTALILSYARKYLRNIEANLNLSLWGGDVVLNDIDIRLDGQSNTRVLSAADRQAIRAGEAAGTATDAAE